MKTVILPLFIILMSTCSIHSRTTLFLTANGVTKTATLVENEATAKLVSILENGPLTLTMTDNGGFEKIGNLPASLPTSDVRQTAKPGDIMLYVGNVLCIFYGSNTWAYTKLGTLDNMNAAEIKEFLSGHPAEVILSLGNDAGIEEISASDIREKKVFDLGGKIVSQRPPGKGLYIIDGRKVFIK